MDNVDNFVEKYYPQPEKKERQDPKQGKKREKGEVRRKNSGIFMSTGCPQKNPHAFSAKKVYKHVDNVDNYRFKRFSPIFITSPAPIVIHRSPCIHFFRRNSSISSKEGK